MYQYLPVASDGMDTFHSNKARELLETLGFLSCHLGTETGTLYRIRLLVCSGKMNENTVLGLDSMPLESID